MALQAELMASAATTTPGILNPNMITVLPAPLAPGSLHLGRELANACPVILAALAGHTGQHPSANQSRGRLRPIASIRAGGGMDTPRKLAAILAADIAGYIRLMGAGQRRHAAGAWGIRWR
jgi:hypothetical protein